MCKECEATIKGLKMKKRRSIRGLTSNGLLTMGKNIGASFVGYYGADMLTENIDFMKENDVTDGLVKVGGALGLSMIPALQRSDMGMSALVGFGLHGVKKLINSFAKEGESYVHGNGWDSYDRPNQTAANKRRLA
jgi:hypothetical protein